MLRQGQRRNRSKGENQEGSRYVKEQEWSSLDVYAWEKAIPPGPAAVLSRSGGGHGRTTLWLWGRPSFPRIPIGVWRLSYICV